MEKLLDVVFKTQASECAAAKPKRSTKAVFFNPFFYIFIHFSCQNVPNPTNYCIK